jgi:type IV pilus assembly protein PilM
LAHTVVGLDIGTTGVRAAEFRLGRHAPYLRKFATVPLPAGAIRAGVIADRPAVTDALRELWATGKFSTKSVALGIANEGVFVRQMDLEWMPRADFAKALRYQVADALPFPVDETNLDYHLLDELDVPTEQEGQTRKVARILLVAAAREVVDNFVGAMQGAGLRAVRADLLAFALIRAACPERKEDGPTEAIIDIGADTVVVIVHQGGRPRFVRMIPGLGSESITQALQDRYEWSWADAERTKIALGLPGQPGQTGPPAQSGQSGQLADGVQEPDPLTADHPAQQLISQQVSTLIAEVRTTLDFFLGADSESARLSRVVLAGSGARLAGLAPLLAAQMGVPVEPLSVLGALARRSKLRLTDAEETCLAVPAGLWLGVPAP